MLYNEGFAVTGADISTEGFRNPEILIVKGDLDSRFPFEDGTFDYACCIDGPEHSENVYHTFREFSRVLKKGGLFAMSYPNYVNIESRMRNIFYGILEPVEPYNAKDYKNNGHISRPPYALLKMALNYAGLEIESIESEKIKYNQLFLLPIALIIFLFTKIGRERAAQVLASRIQCLECADGRQRTHHQFQKSAINTAFSNRRLITTALARRKGWFRSRLQIRFLGALYREKGIVCNIG
jgi:SAM-dependent methyltransferase